MAEVDRSPCRLCGSEVEVRAELVTATLGTPTAPYRPVRVCTSLLCTSNLAGQERRKDAAETA